MDQQRLQFHTSESKDTAFHRGKDRIAYTLRAYSGNRQKTRSKQEVDAGSMLLKLGICAAACMLVLLINSRESWQGTYTSASNDGGEEKADTTDDTLQEETPGQLRFVELPGLLSVFAADEKKNMPIECTNYLLEEENTVLCMDSDKTQNVFVTQSAIVEEIGINERLGNYVCLKTEEGLMQLSGLDAISVEKGQKLARQDTLGRIEKGCSLRLKLTLTNGAAANLKSYFSLDKTL